MKLHILGLGSIGTLHGFYFQKQLNIPIYILSKSLERTWETLSFVDKQSQTHRPHFHQGLDTPIHHLLICTKAHQTVNALKPWIKYLSPRSTIILLQNGVLGVYSQLQQLLPCYASGGPSFILGSTTHGVTRKDHTFYHKGFGETIFGSLEDPIPFETQSILSIFSTVSCLNVRIQNQASLLQTLLIKIVINSVINCLTAIYQTPNGSLLESDHAMNIMNALVEEIHPIVQTDLIGLNSSMMMERILKVLRHTAANHSSMKVDVSLGKDTEMDYIVGHLIQRAAQMGRTLPLLELIRKMVLLKLDLVRSCMTHVDSMKR